MIITNIGKYCKQLNMTKEEYNNFKNNLIVTAQAIRSTLNYKGGMYFETKSLFHWNINEQMKYFIIQELKKLNIEFTQNNDLYRVV